MKAQLLSAVGLLLFLTAMTVAHPSSILPSTGPPVLDRPVDKRKPIPEFLEKGMDWLASAQAENGGWVAGSHSNQTERDPHAVKVDPGTTAFSAMALMRSGSTLTSGPYRRNLVAALDYVLRVVDAAPPNAVNLTDVVGTQPQVKLGQNIDVSMVTQFLSEILVFTRHDPELTHRVEAALDKCLHMLEVTQDADGSWNSRGGWAGVLQSAMANNALEVAQSAGRPVDADVLDKSRQYQKGNLDAASGSIRTEAAAGVSLYSIASNQRATAQEAKTALEAVESGRRDGVLTSAEVSEQNLQRLGYSDDEAARLKEAYDKNRVAEQMLENEAVLSGFGNNGGEEFLSYMMASESLVLSESDQWDDWYAKMRDRLSRIQNGDGSWSGHHCITSPVFCTAAVILTLTADRGAFAAQMTG